MEPEKNIINIESPIMTKLEIEKEQSTLIAKMTFANMSDQNVVVDKQKLGGEKLREHIFHLNPWHTSPNITFHPYNGILSFTNSSPNYIILKPKQVIVTKTDLKQYYNLNECSYETLSICYVAMMDFLDENFNNILQKDDDGETKKVMFNIISNDIDLDYNKDIKPYL